MDFSPLRRRYLAPVTELFHRAWQHDRAPSSVVAEKLWSDTPGMSDSLGGFDEQGLLKAMVTLTVGTRKGHQTAWIRLFAISPDELDRGWGTGLLDLAEGWARDFGCDRLRVMDCPRNYLVPGIDLRYRRLLGFLESRGFATSGEARNLRVSLRGRRPEEMGARQEEIRGVLAERGVEVRRLERGDLDSLELLLASRFSRGWAEEVTRAAEGPTPAVHLALVDGAIAGFAAHNGNNRGTGSFGPMGVLPERRGMGLGECLVLRCMVDIAEMGFTRALIPWAASLSFYEKTCDAQVYRTFRQLEKRLG